MRVHNTTDTSVTIDEEGRSLDGFTSDDVPNNRFVRQAISAGSLVRCEDVPDEDSTGDSDQRKKQKETVR